MDGETSCGLSFWHPKWLQRFATSKGFMIVYGLLGTIQAMSYMYFIVTLTTIEKRFKIPSQTTGIILSGNEISQILLSLVLSYAGGQRNRPRWIAWGIIFCGISCFILAVPHFIYGAGDDILRLTKEHLGINKTDVPNTGLKTTNLSKIRLCSSTAPNEECGQLVTLLPLILIFLSQFVLGIGNTLYYSLGQTYLDDNTKMSNTPMMLAYAMSLRMLGPIGGFLLGYGSLNIFIDPSKTPLIDKKDPRWLGAWWFGWIILGSSMLIFSGLIGMFPKVLAQNSRKSLKKSLTRTQHQNREYDEGYLPIQQLYNSSLSLDKTVLRGAELPQMKDFPKALLRLLKNKILVCNIVAGIFYILGAGGYMTFIAKYIEVQFHKTAQNATIVVGPLTILGIVLGFMFSGFVVSRKKPRATVLLTWNIFIGIAFLCGQIAYMFIYCGDTSAIIKDGRVDLSSNCNFNCSCEKVAYNPVCNEESGATYFSACHAGCKSWNPQAKIFSNCSCLEDQQATDKTYKKNYTFAHSPANEHTELENGTSLIHMLKPGACVKGCKLAFYLFTALSVFINCLGSSGRIGNLLVNYRAVEITDKSFAQGLLLMLVSLFALIPGPIIYGRIIDSTCLVWTSSCGTRGHCQFYDQEKFRLYMNTAAIVFTFIGVVFDVLVLYYGRNIDFYGEIASKTTREKDVKNQTTSPLILRRN